MVERSGDVNLREDFSLVFSSPAGSSDRTFLHVLYTVVIKV